METQELHFLFLSSVSLLSRSLCLFILSPEGNSESTQPHREAEHTDTHGLGYIPVESHAWETYRRLKSYILSALSVFLSPLSAVTLSVSASVLFRFIVEYRVKEKHRCMSFIKSDRRLYRTILIKRRTQWTTKIESEESKANIICMYVRCKVGNHSF